MIRWIERKKTEPSDDGEYLVWQFAGQWDCEWIDIARYSKSERKFHSFGRQEFSHDVRTRYWAPVNYPPTICNEKCEREAANDAFARIVERGPSEEVVRALSGYTKHVLDGGTRGYVD